MRADHVVELVCAVLEKAAFRAFAARRSEVGVDDVFLACERFRQYAQEKEGQGFDLEDLRSWAERP